MTDFVKLIKLKMRKFTFLQKPYSRVKVSVIEKKRHYALHKYGYKILEEMTSALDTYNIPAFCAFGTLLGMIRDKGFISSDDDIDMGVIECEGFDWVELEKCLSSIGMSKIRQFELQGKVTEQTYKKMGVCVDFFLYMKDQNKLTANVYWIDEKRKYSIENGHSVLYRDCPMINTIIKETVRSISVPIPQNYEDYLRWTYGAKWRIPDPFFKPEKYVRTEAELEAHRTDFC
ncbi:MAG: LicD family protein [Ruminococcus flavefaciens]|nr:LicD family protein [Ruminococcus flavefaciens]